MALNYGDDITATPISPATDDDIQEPDNDNSSNPLTAVTGSGIAALCGLCRSLTAEKLTAPHGYFDFLPESERAALNHPAARYGFLHHRSRKEQRAAAANGCRLCLLLRSLNSYRPLTGRVCVLVGRSFVPTAEQDAQSPPVMEFRQDATGRTFSAVRAVLLRTHGEWGSAQPLGDFQIFWNCGTDQEYLAARQGYRDSICSELVAQSTISNHTYLDISLEGQLSELSVNYRTLQIMDCIQHHDCPKPTNREHSGAEQRPLRLLDVRVANGEICYLVKGASSAGPYIALSYCWGVDPPSLTTSSTIEEYTNKGLVISAMPSTWQDAVAVARAYDIDYIWIDGLCIVQDDVIEWDQQAKRMCDIYQGAYLTIVAPGSRSCRDGFLHEAQLEDTAIRFDASYKRPKQGTFYMRQSRHSLIYAAAERFEYSTWNRRGWTLQEKILSSRILYFTPNGTIFECRQCPNSVHPALMLFQSLADFHKPGQDWLTRWRRVIQDYTERSLTKEGDTLVALAGLVDLFQKETGLAPVYGMWDHDLYREVHWVRFGDPAAASVGAYAPSWSWASWNLASSSAQRISMPDRHFTDGQNRRDYTLTRVQDLGEEQLQILRKVSAYPYQSPDDQVLSVTTRLVRTGGIEKHVCEWPCAANHCHRINIPSLERPIDSPDTDVISARICNQYVDELPGEVSVIMDDRLAERDHFWIAVTRRVRRGSGEGCWLVLALENVHAPNFYKRVGVSFPFAPQHIDLLDRFLEGIATQEIIIV